MVIKGGGEKSGKMMYRVYIDMIFAVNLLMDLAVLAMLNQLFSYRADFKHMLKGAFVGALWACILAAFPGIPLILQMFGTYVAAGALMAAVAYGIRSRREILRAVGGIYLISVVLGGVMLALGRKQSGKKSYKMDAGKLSGQAVSGCRSCILVCMAFTVSASFEHPKRGKQAFKKCYLVLCRPDHKDQRPDRYRKPFKSSCKRSAGPCSYSRTDETSLPGSKRGHVCSLSMHRQQRHPSSCKDRRNESGRREGKLCDTKAMDRYNKGKLIST